jgi:glucose-6-phosphate 1-dehydrogenase
VSLCLFSNDKKWRGVPFLLRTGKNLAEKVTEIKIIFRPNKTNEPPNILIFRIQPKEGIELNLRVKKPGFKEKLETAAMDFSYNVRFDDNGHPDAYERVIVDAVKGDHTLFATSEEVLSSWRIIEPIIQQWTKNKFDLVSYEKGSWGPIEAEKLAEKYGSSWKQNIGSLG